MKKKRHVLTLGGFIVLILALLSAQRALMPPAEATVPPAEPVVIIAPVEKSTPPATLEPIAETIPVSVERPAPEPAVNPAVVEPAPVSSALQAEIDRILQRNVKNLDWWGIDVYSIQDREFLYSLNSGQHFPPASNVKVFTTAAALDRLSPEFRFQTHVAYEGMLAADGTLFGDLALIGEGDPDLADRINEGKDPFVHLDQMAEKVRAAGIRSIEGDIIGDDSYFLHSPHGDGWLETDLDKAYGAPVSALSFNDNLISFWARPSGQVGQPTRIWLEPAVSFVKLENATRTGKVSRRITLNSSNPLKENRFRIWGELPISVKSYSRKIPVEDAALFAAALFRERLDKVGVKVRGNTRARHSGDLGPLTDLPVRIYTHESRPLLEIVSYTNKESQNLYAEIILRTLGAQVKGLGADYAGLRVVSEFLEEAGTGPETAILHDGSGLSRLNQITPRAQTLLFSYLSGKYYFPQFLESLPVSGYDGTLKNRMRKSAAASRVHAKTGSLSNVVTLGGYVETNSGRMLAFSVLVNNTRQSLRNPRQVTDQICDVLAAY